MSSHLWDVKRPTENTVRFVHAAYLFARRKGMNFNDACRFAAYLAESDRQKYGTPRVGSKREVQRELRNRWESAERSKHRYAEGKNADLYAGVGRVIVCSAIEWGFFKEPSSTIRAVLASLREGQECDFALHDLLQEEGFFQSAEDLGYQH